MTRRPVEPGQVTRRTARNVAFASIAEFVGKFGSLAFLVYGARELSRGDFGAFSYAFAFAGLVASLLQWGFDGILIREAAEHPERLPQVVAETYVWRIVVGVPAFIAIGLIGALTRPSGAAATALLLVLLAFFFDTTMRTPIAGAEALQQMSRPAMAIFVERIATAIGGVVALAAGFGLAGYSGAYLAGAVFGAFAVIVAVRPIGVRADFSTMTRKSFFAIGKASIPLGVDFIVAIGLFKLDAILLGIMKGDASLAVYAVAYRLLETVLFVTFAVVTTVYAVMSASKAIDRIRTAIERGLAVCAAVYVPFAIAVLFRPSGILTLLFGAQYAHSSAVPLAWLGITPLLIAWGNLVSIALVACHRVKGVLLSSVAALIVNLVLNLFLIPTMGPTGAAIANIAAYGFEAVVLTVLGARVFGWTRLDRAFAESVGAGAAMAVVLALLHQGTVIDLAAAGIAYGIVWLALSFRFAPQNIAVLRSFIGSQASGEPTAISWKAPVRDGPAPIAWRGVAADVPPAIVWRQSAYWR